MKRYLMHILVALNAVLVLALLAMWFDAGGQLRNARWPLPAAIKPDFAAMLAPLAMQRTDDVSRFVATLDRPLFSPTRRPPPPPAPAPPPDPLANIQLFGVYSGPEGGGLIARVDGKMRRANLKDKIGDWTITRIVDRDVTFARGAEVRVVTLAKRQPATAAPAPAGAATPSQVIPGQPAPGRLSAEELMRMTPAQRIVEENRERLRYLNEMRIKNGLPPITHR